MQKKAIDLNYKYHFQLSLIINESTTEYPAATPPSLSKYLFVLTKYPPTSLTIIFYPSVIKYPITLISLITAYKSKFPLLIIKPILGIGLILSIIIKSVLYSGVSFSNSGTIYSS